MTNYPQSAKVYFDSWAGCTGRDVIVIGETPKRYRVQWVEAAFGRLKGATSLVPKHAVKFEQIASEKEKDSK